MSLRFPTKADAKPGKKAAPPVAAAKPAAASRATARPVKADKAGKGAKPAKPAKPAADPNAFLKNPVRWLKRFFRRPLRLQRKGLDFKVVLDPAVTRFSDSALSAARGSPSDTADVQAMRLELAAVLDRDPRSRKVLVHLNMLERALKSKGMKAFDDLPPELLRKAMAQLDTLVMDWSARGLTLLRARASGTLARTKVSAVGRMDFGDTTHVQVREASVTTFMEVEQEWERSMTGKLEGSAFTSKRT